MITIVEKIEEANCITHSGTIHADEVFATAFLELYLKEIKLFRTPEIKIENVSKEIYVYDIGGGQFDHHQEDARRRENNIKYSSFGLLWQEYGQAFLKQQQITEAEKVFHDFDKDFVEGIDAVDNGVFPKIDAPYKVKTISDIIKIFNPSYGSDQQETEQFLKAQQVAKKILLEELSSVVGKTNAKQKVLAEIEKAQDRTLYLTEYMPYEEALLSSGREDIDFVIFPSNRGGYAIKTLPKSMEDHSSRVDFPEEWAGLMNEELEQVTNIPGITFCHANRFLVSCDSLKTAKIVIKETLRLQQKEENKDE